MINIFEVNETNKMIEQENLDVRTITMGISLLDCIDSDLAVLNEKIYKKITTCAKDLVSTGEAISGEYGIPIVNKRISVTPIALIGGAACKTKEDFVTIAETLDKAAKVVGVNFIGGYSALVSKGMTPAERLLIESIPQAMAKTERVCSSVNVGSTRTGINMDAVKLMGEIVLETAKATKDQDSLGCAKLVVFCNAPDDNPFMAGAFHGVTEADTIINVGVSGPGVVKTALEQVRGKDFETLCEMIKRTAFKVTRVGQLVAQEASRRLGVKFGIVDLSLAPTPAIGDSVAYILEEMGLEKEIIDKIMAENGSDIENTKKKLEAERDNYKSQLETAQETLKSFDGVDVNELKGKITQLTNDLEAKENEYQGKLADIEFTNAIESALTGAGAKNTKAVKALLDIESLKSSKNQAEDIKKALEAVKSENDYLFVSNETFKNPVKDIGNSIKLST